MFDMEYVREPGDDEKCLIIVDNGTMHNEFYVRGYEVNLFLEPALKLDDADILVFSFCKGYSFIEEDSKK